MPFDATEDTLKTGTLQGIAMAGPEAKLRVEAKSPPVPGAGPGQFFAALA